MKESELETEIKEANEAVLTILKNSKEGQKILDAYKIGIDLGIKIGNKLGLYEDLCKFINKAKSEHLKGLSVYPC